MAALTFVIAESTTALGGYIEISTAAATEEPRKRVSIHEQHMILGRAGWHVPVTAMEGRSVSRLVIVLPNRLLGMPRGPGSQAEELSRSMAAISSRPREFRHNLSGAAAQTHAQEACMYPQVSRLYPGLSAALQSQWTS